MLSTASLTSFLLYMIIGVTSNSHVTAAAAAAAAGGNSE